MLTAETTLLCPRIQKARKIGRPHHRGEDPWRVLLTTGIPVCSCLLTCDCLCSNSSLYTSRSMPTLSDQQEVQPDGREPLPAQTNTKSMPHLASACGSNNKTKGEWSHYHKVNLFCWLLWLIYITLCIWSISRWWCPTIPWGGGTAAKGGSTVQNMYGWGSGCGVLAMRAPGDLCELCTQPEWLPHVSTAHQGHCEDLPVLRWLKIL
jgi:hypothetical protein